MSATWRDFARVVVGTWPAVTWADETLAAYVGEVKARGLSPDDAIGAVRASGSQFVASAGALAALVPRDGDARPTSAEAWALLEQAIRRVGCSVYSPAFGDQHAAAIDWLAERDVVLAAFANRRGLTGAPGSLGFEAVDDPGVGGAVRGRLAKDWREAVDAAADREARGLPPVRPEDLARRELGAASGGMGGVVERLRPVRGLEA